MRRNGDELHVEQLSGAWRIDDNTRVPFGEALEAWASVAVDLLLTTARSYGATVTHKQLAKKVQDATGIIEGDSVDQWIPLLLDRVAAIASKVGAPPVTSLCIGADGSVGLSYSLRMPDDDLVDWGDDVDLLAAHHRLACYRKFARNVPADAAPELPDVLIRSRLKHHVAGAPARTAKPQVTRAPKAASTGSAPQATTRRPGRPRGSAAAPRKPEPAPPSVCPSCFTQLPANGECDYCA
ncbi:MAG: hypothetical protein LBB54_05780 [Cellulomonadaceae bacterium]|jgi:hypothetical protein|nr:hypothetical protein [Cellulomonadaceae bacterium]